MKHDYASVKQELLMALTEDSGSRWATFCREHYPAIKHALAMMQKLQEPSGAMIYRGDNEVFHPEKENASEPSRGVLKAMLEQAEKEIADA